MTWVLRRLWFQTRALFRIPPRPNYAVTIISENPAHEDVPLNQILIVGTYEYQKWAYLRCPCGCKELIMLSLSYNRRPRWRVDINENTKSPTIHPSIRKTDTCYAHFWIKYGEVLWCKDSCRKPHMIHINPHR